MTFGEGSLGRSARFVGYTDRFSYAPGSTVEVMMTGSGKAQVELVRLRNGPHVSETDVETVDWDYAGQYEVREQISSLGSFMVVSRPWEESSHHVTFTVRIWPTLIKDQLQTLMSTGDGQVSISTRRDEIVVSVHNEQHVLNAAIEARQWYEVRVELHGLTIKTTVSGRERSRLRNRWFYSEALEREFHLNPPDHLLIGADRLIRLDNSGPLPHGLASDLFNGKLESPVVGQGRLPEMGLARGQHDRKSLLGGWTFVPTESARGSAVANVVAGRPDGILVNLPTRGVTGYEWTARSRSWHDSANEYGAVHFHETDLADAGWVPTLRAELPVTLQSGVYAVHVRTESLEDFVPLVVLPESGSARPPVLVVLPSFSYLAYGNETNYETLDDELMQDPPEILRPYDSDRLEIRAYGQSLYQTHADGSGVAFSSWRRPLPNIRHDYSFWAMGPEAGNQFASDMHLVEWLDRQGIQFDVMTDLEVHELGASGLSDYRVVLTGHHPEYTTQKMLDAFTAFRDRGGNFVYLGGNGFYWVTGLYSSDPTVVEIRRGQSGIRCWESEPGEVTLYSTGEPGGLWRHRGQAPQALTGIGMAAQGFGDAVGYVRTEASRNGPSAWIFDGVEEDPVGQYGGAWNGAAGLEVDRVDWVLGTPPQTVILAHTEEFSRYYMRDIAELAMTSPGKGDGPTDPDVRGDLVHCVFEGGGQVVSVGSMNWISSLLFNGGDNGVSRITRNVIDRFSASSAANASHGDVLDRRALPK